MPYLVLNTNVKVADPKAFAAEFSKFAAETINIPEAYINFQFNYNDSLIFGGSFDPCFNLSIANNLQPEMNEGYSKKIFEWLDAKLGVKHDRGYILFTDPGSGQIGYVFRLQGSPPLHGHWMN
ncbi:hypothetical protein AGABI2DRAFT_200279 [Agaricus bisporus var. bisporus H97]|uniref:hypothetical protein n=1 Tax=Agaricus bisporus var. bisporus (strain H97 / ATCC MYA-4626 / FGSC 10389) TaxID=936046 RepID=UPI00029F7A99|nr:hypothetical protein AGABI2DRAFT_200279 [Agaricus bisporus var. bisporus H97]EKV50503.1 hypothetical protein AGABI2DRAFT_200279 [Agaricus bisporus var. bisporus H97]